jgi:hypothetical protein
MRYVVTVSMSSRRLSSVRDDEMTIHGVKVVSEE